MSNLFGVSLEKGSKKYTQGDIARMIEDIYPCCISDTTINNIFSAANKKRLEVIARAKQKQADDAKLMRDAF